MFKGLKYTILSLLTVAKHLFKKSVTLEYPEKKKNTGDYFRGKPVVGNCVACGMCLKVCPSGAIHISKENGIITTEIDLNKCIFCGNCAFYCPKSAIKMSKLNSARPRLILSQSILQKIKFNNGICRKR